MKKYILSFLIVLLFSYAGYGQDVSDYCATLT